MTYSEQLVTGLNQAIKKHFNHITSIKKSFKQTLSGISRLVMLDRYSQKDKNLISLEIGNLVLVSFKGQQNFQIKVVCRVVEIKKYRVVVQAEPEYVHSISQDFLIAGTSDLMSVAHEFIAKPLELFWEQICHRVTKHLAIPEDSYKNGLYKSDEFESLLYQEIVSKQIVPAGRILFGAGSNTIVTYFNCFVLPLMPDSRLGIANHRQIVMEIMSRGGGVGTNGSTLRPRNEIVRKVNGHSSGSVSWLNDIANLTHLVEQGGSRRGAQMIMLADWHPDIIDFIISKMQNPDILLYLWKTSPDKKIRNAARDKLTFIKPTSSEISFSNAVINNPSLFSKADFENATKIKERKGVWKVSNPEFLSGANISVTLTDEFIDAVKNNQNWKLKFPDLCAYNEEQSEIYDKEWHKVGDIRAWENKGLKSKVYYKLPARALWNLITVCATYSAEPGVFFIDTANKFTNSSSYDQKVIATNPCGEQPLPAWSVCNLSAINLAKFVDYKTENILYDKLEKSVRLCIRMQDNVITQTPYFLEENKSQATKERRIGLGVMGLHDLLIFAGYKYGSDRSLKIIDKIFRKICYTAYEESVRLASERGQFLFLNDRKRFIKTGFVSTLSESLKTKILRHGIRNSHLLTVAPTGTTGTLADVSTGLEPYFAYKYYRSGRLGTSVKINASVVDIYKKYHPKTDPKNLPDIFVTANDLSAEQHVNVQLIIQRWIDSSISKTVNAPSTFTTADVEKVYMSLFDGGAKGGTVYVDGSRNFQVLNLIDPDKDNSDQTAVSPPKCTKKNTTSKFLIDTAVVSPDKLNRSVGNNIGDICAMCTQGILVMQNGCATCANCNCQLKCAA